MMRWRSGGGELSASLESNPAIPKRSNSDELDAITTSADEVNPTVASSAHDDYDAGSPSMRELTMEDDDDDDDNEYDDYRNGAHSSNPDDDQHRSSDTPSTIDDDDGADHAECEPIPWRPQNVQSTCEFTHIITDYAQKRESGCKKAEYSDTTVDEFGNRWRLIVYVNGNGRASNHHLSLFLQVADADDLPFGWKKAVSYVLTLEHPEGPTLSYAKRNPDKTFKLCPKAIDWGWSQFITSDRIQQEGFVSNDSLTVRAQVSVKSSSVSIDDEDAELYLKCAVEEGDVEAVRLCLEHGASVNCQFKDDLYTPLHTACSSSATVGSMEVLNLLLQEGADCNACNKWKETPLLIAANNGHHAAVDALLKHGADPSLCSEAGWSALTFAAHKGYDDIVALLLGAGAPVNCPVTEDSSTPLHKACAGSKPSHLASVNLLLEAGADVHALNKWRETPLLTAANHGQAGAVAALLQRGADPCKCTDTGWSPLSIAAYKGHDEVVRILLEEGAPTEEDDPTLSALLQAATKGLPDTVELLLRHGADHTVTTKKGDTALSILVEQNLIDAAVEMVTEYNANIPRCSKDRKKVQRARLLITLRMKQLEREGKHIGGRTIPDDEDDDDELVSAELEDEPSALSQKAARDDAEQRSQKRKTKKTSNTVSAEEKARAAEEALLLQLEQEESAKKEACSKRKKKKERKAKEREMKHKEELDRKVQAEEESKQREYQRVQEDMQRKEQEKLEKARLEKEEMERRAREEEERHKKEKLIQHEQSARRNDEQKRRELKAKVATSSESLKKEKDTSTNGKLSDKRTKPLKPKKAASVAPEHKNGLPAKPSNTINSSAIGGGNRRWETASLNKMKSSPQSAGGLQPEQKRETSVESVPNGSQYTSDRHAQKSFVPANAGTSPDLGWSVEQQSYSVAGSPQGLPHGDTQSSFDLRSVSLEQGLNPQPALHVEHPAISLYRREKVSELLQRCSQVLAVSDGSIVKRILYRWSVRAAHDPSPTTDPLIPSWPDLDRMVAFFQRQLIAEFRRAGSTLGVEALREAGSIISLLCHNLAEEVGQFRRRVEEQLPADWTDSDLGMEANGSIAGGDLVTIAWANRAQVLIPSPSFRKLRSMYIGPPARLLAACFMAKMLYDTRRLVVTGTPMDFKLSPRTKLNLLTNAGVTAELWSDPFSCECDSFWGTFHSSDYLFRGLDPFGRVTSSNEQALLMKGGTFTVLLPMDATVAASYVQRMTDILKQTKGSSVPISFVVFAHADSFIDITAGPSSIDLRQLDPRLGLEERHFVRNVESLPPNNHVFQDGDGEEVLSNTASLLFFLQNDAGTCHLDSNAVSLSALSSAASVLPKLDNTLPSTMGLTTEFHNKDLPLSSYNLYFDTISPMSSDPSRVMQGEFGAIGGAPIPQPFSPASDLSSRATYRGRLFDLVDNEEEDEVDLVSGMLNSLDVGLFQNTNVGPDVDIEAISLMGIGAPPSQTIPSARSQQGRFR